MRLVPLLAGLAVSTGAAASALSPIADSRINAGGGEILAWDASRRLLVSTMADREGGHFGIELIDLADPRKPTTIATIDARRELIVDGFVPSDVTSVTVDPRGRGIAAMTVVPSPSNASPGRVVFFDLATRRPLASVAVGYHPDCARFSRDGAHLLIANEGEYVTSGNQTPGSLTVLDLSGYADASALAASLPTPATYDFGARHLGPLAREARMRVNRADAAGRRWLDVEPEYLDENDGKVYVTLQENNAIGVFDLASRRWTRILDLGLIEQTVDATDREASGQDPIAIVDRIGTLPMPDAVASFDQGGRRYLVTVNEGDARGDDGDLVRLESLAASGHALDPALRRSLDALPAAARARLQRLKVSLPDADVDGDGDLDRLVGFGSRSFTVWNAESGSRVYDSGDFFETYVAAHDPETFNMNDGDPGKRDQRSDDSGPEPEALVLGEHAGRRFAFVGMERQNGIFAFDLSDPAKPAFVGYWNGLRDAHVSPESLVFIPADESGIGKPLLAVGFELSHTLAVLAFDPP